MSLLDQKKIKWIDTGDENPLSLPSKYYYDPELFSIETKTIHHRTWHCVCHYTEIPKSGDYIKFDLLGQSVLVLRGKEGEIFAYHNVCQHRGTELVKEKKGNFPRLIVCPYHAWCYEFNGHLRNAPRTEKLENFDTSRIKLKSVRYEIFAGFIFVNFDQDTKPLADDLVGAEKEMRRFMPDLDDIVLVNELDYIVDANWKVIVDNAIEGYHFQLSGPVHKDLASLIDFTRYDLRAHGKWWDFKGPPTSVTTAFGHPIANEKYQSKWFYNIQLWPTTTFYVFPYADVIGTFNEIPLGPEKTLLHFGHYAPKTRPQSELSKAVVDWFNNELGPEDIDLNTAVQRGIHSFGFDQGPYVIDPECGPNSEHLVRHFHKLVYETISRDL